jgi:hypothetical protein
MLNTSMPVAINIIDATITMLELITTPLPTPKLKYIKGNSS